MKSVVVRLAFVAAAMAASTMGACGSDGEPKASPPIDAGDGEGAPPDGGIRGTVGAACSDDAQCNEGLLCARKGAPSNEHWPANGMCTARCTKNADCEPHAPGSVCGRFAGIPANDPGVCLEPCEVGPQLGPLSADMLSGGPVVTKCHGRADLACSLLFFNQELVKQCYPVCNDDTACAATGGRCDTSGLCTSQAIAGWDAIGSQPVGGCSTVPSVDGATFCSAMCTLGVVPSCGWKGPGSDATNACMHLLVRGSGRGDRGMCSRLCDCDDDCEAPTHCQTLSADHAVATGHLGVCGFDGTNTACGRGDAGTDAALDAHNP